MQHRKLPFFVDSLQMKSGCDEGVYPSMFNAVRGSESNSATAAYHEVEDRLFDVRCCADTATVAAIRRVEVGENNLFGNLVEHNGR